MIAHATKDGRVWIEQIAKVETNGKTRKVFSVFVDKKFHGYMDAPASIPNIRIPSRIASQLGVA